MSVTLLHVSDMHVTDDPGTVDRLRRVLNVPPARRPDAIVVTGDVADHGAPAEYQAFAAAMPDTPPWLAVPGNHDDPAALRSALGMAECPTLDVGRVRVVGLDVTVPGENHGYLTEDTARLAVERAAGAERVVLAFHQPPVRTGHAVADSMLLTNPDALADLVRRLPVVAVLCGHIHTPLAARLAGVPVLAAPGVASALTFDPDQRPITEPEAAPGFALHRIDDDGAVTTSFHYA
jgi:3',5'-cyclic-AMP phosphodiesterase